MRYDIKVIGEEREKKERKGERVLKIHVRMKINPHRI
jgi:hypothetical protein